MLLVFTGALVAGILWGRARAHSELCTRVEVRIANSDTTHFVTEKGIIDGLKKHGIYPVGKPMSAIDATAIEQALRASEYLEQADCVKGTQGRVIITVSQLVPVMRVFDGNNCYYVNRAGKRMAATAAFHADVPVVQGHFTAAYPPTRLLPMIDYVERDTTLRSLVTMYMMRDTNNIYFVPSISDHVVNMGTAQDYAAKFKKLRLFYSKVLPARGWLTYDTISLKWHGQVVATRRAKAVKTVIEYDPEDDEPMADAETMGIDGAPIVKPTTPKNQKPKTKTTNN